MTEYTPVMSYLQDLKHLSQSSFSAAHSALSPLPVFTLQVNMLVNRMVWPLHLVVRLLPCLMVSGYAPTQPPPPITTTSTLSDTVPQVGKVPVFYFYFFASSAYYKLDGVALLEAESNPPPANSTTNTDTQSTLCLENGFGS